MKSEPHYSTLTLVNQIINATPLGMKVDESSPLQNGPLTAKHFFYETVYIGGETALLKHAKPGGAKGAGVLSMLLHKGAF